MSFVDGGDAFSSFAPAVSTATYWDVDGISLQTLAFDIETIGGSRMGPPALRGSDITIPSAPGDMWLPKQVASRNISLDMWVIGANEDGSVPTGDVARQFDANYRKLRQLLWTPNRQFTLTKRFYVDGVLKTASAKGQYAGGLDPSMTGRSRASFNVDIRLADPYFYGPEINTNLVTGTQTVTVEGDDYTRAVKLYIVGPRVNVKVRNSTLNVDVEYRSGLSSGDVLDINVKKYTSITDTVALAPYNSYVNIRHSGDAFWLILQPGVNTIVVSSLTGIGGVTLTHAPVWL